MFELEGELLKLEKVSHVGNVYQSIPGYWFSYVVDTQLRGFKGDSKEECESIRNKLCEALRAESK